METSGMKIAFGYGNTIQTVTINDKNLIDVLGANVVEHKYKGSEAVRYALRNPIGAPMLHELVKPKQKIAIVASDISRPVPSYEIIPEILEELFAAGCVAEDITIVFAIGSHRKHSEDEKRKLVGERVFDNISCIDAGSYGFCKLGETKAGTPVDICRIVAEADFRICTGNIEFHYFAGYSGGAKAIMPGTSTTEAIQKNHRMMVQNEACAGELEGNPIREDIEEAAQICGVDYIVNVVLDENKKIVYAVAGDMIKAHRDGCAYLDKMYRKKISQKADIVVASPGGAPKDVNLYQTQKALDNAKHAVKSGGCIILIGECSEGTGNQKFEEWITNADSPQTLIERINENFELGGHKAAAIAMVLEKAEIHLVSELDDDFVRSIFMIPHKSVQEAFDKVLKKYGENASIIAMPYGSATLPYVI